MHVLERGRGRANHDDLAGERARLEVAASDAVEGDDGDVLAAVVVDPGLLGERVGGHLLARAALDRCDGERLEALEGVRHAPDHAPRIGGIARVGRAGVQRPQHVVSPEHVRAAPVVDDGGGEDHVPRERDRVRQRLVIRPDVRGLCELHVVGDHPCAVGVQLADRLRVERARKRPLLAELAKALVVDAHDGDVLRRVEIASDREAGVDGVELRVLEHVGRVRGDNEAREHQRRTEEDQQAQALRGAPPRRERAHHLRHTLGSAVSGG